MKGPDLYGADFLTEISEDCNHSTYFGFKFDKKIDMLIRVFLERGRLKALFTMNVCRVCMNKENRPLIFRALFRI